MSTHAITLELPEPLYRRIVQRAAGARHSIEDELTVVLSDALAESATGLPAALEEELAQMQFLDDDSLWRAALLRVPDASADRLEALAEKRQTEGLSNAESQEVEQLLNLADRVMLIRAQAAVLLKERGHDITKLVESSDLE